MSVVIAPGSRSTPITLSLATNPAVDSYVHLDERSAAFFALGRSKLTGEPTPLICTSGTAAANFHPAVIEADQARVPMLILTADRPPELHDSGANQTVPQDRLYADATRWQQTLPEPSTDAQIIRSVQTTITRAITTSTQPPAGPVHLNIPFRKPFQPSAPTDLPDPEPSSHDAAVTTSIGRHTLTDSQLSSIENTVNSTTKGLIVVGPQNPYNAPTTQITALATATGFPILADPLSGLRYSDAVGNCCVCGGYDAYLDPAITEDWPAPNIVLRFGASPTSQQLQDYLTRTDPRQFLIDPVGDWRDATFTATDLVGADPAWFASTLADRLQREPSEWTNRFYQAETSYWDYVANTDATHEGNILTSIIRNAPADSTVFVANSMPVRDLDRFGQPRSDQVTVIGNRGASGIDGNTSTALGAGTASSDHLTAVLGDLAFYHDMNGLLAIDRFNIPVTIVMINNNGGGIFHKLPIEAHDPPFISHFKTPHGLDFEPVSELYDLSFDHVTSTDQFASTYMSASATPSSHLIEVVSDAKTSHETRDQLQRGLVDRFSAHKSL